MLFDFVLKTQISAVSALFTHHSLQNALRAKCLLLVNARISTEAIEALVCVNKQAGLGTD